MNKNTKSKLPAILISLAMAFTMMPMMGGPACASGYEDINLSDLIIEVPVKANEIAWLKDESNGSGTWFGLDNRDNTFPEGTAFWEASINKESNPAVWTTYYGMLDEAHKRKVDQNRIRIFLCGAVGPDGTEIRDFGGKTKDLYIQLGSDWDKDDIKAVFIDKDKDEDLQVESLNDFVGPEGTKEFTKLKLEHFSPYAVYQEKKDGPSGPEVKPSAPKKSAANTPKTSGTPLARATAKKKSLILGWNRIQGASGYDIFFARCDRHGKKTAFKKVKTIKGNSTFKWKKSGLKKGAAYKFYVRAYVTKNGKKTYVSKSPTIHAYTGKGSKNRTNAKSVTLRNVRNGKLSLGMGRTFRIKAKVNKVNGKKKLMSKGHTPTLRFLTSDRKVAAVSNSGRITAKGKGTCYIYAFAHNGVSKQIRVTVK